MYLANNKKHDIAFAVDLLARYSNSPTKRHWSGIKHLLCYLRGTKDLALFYRSKQDATLVGYQNAGYLSDPNKAKSQNGYVFTYEGTTRSWRFTYETSRECV